MGASVRRAFPLGVMLILGTSLVVMPGCGSGGGSRSEEAATRSVPVTIAFQDDRGQSLETFPLGSAVFATVDGLSPRQLYTLNLYAPGASPGPAEGAGPSASSGSREGPAESSGEAAPPSAAPPEAGPPALVPESEAPPALEPPGSPPDEGSPAAPLEAVPPPPPPPGQLAARPGALIPLAEDIPIRFAADETGVEPAPAEQPAPEVAPAPAPSEPVNPPSEEPSAGAAAPAPEPGTAPPPLGAPAPIAPLLAGAPSAPIAFGKYVADSGGTIPAVLVIRDVGRLESLPAGGYTLVVTSADGKEVSRGTFTVTDSKALAIYPVDGEGRLKTAFRTSGESVFVAGEGLDPSASATLYIVSERGSYSSGDSLEGVAGEPVKVEADGSGKFRVEAWPAPHPAGPYDLVLDVNNDGRYDPDTDVADGVRTAGLLVEDAPAGGTDRVKDLACTEDVYEQGWTHSIPSDKGLYVRALCTVEGEGGEAAKIWVCDHRAEWGDGEPLEPYSRAQVEIGPVGGGSVGIERTLVWPAPLLPGEYDVIVDVDGNGRYTRGVDLVDRRGAEVEGREVGVVVTDAGNLVNITGRVEDSDGEPVPGALVQCRDSVARSVTTGQDGTYQLDGVLPVTVRVQASAAGHLAGEVVVPASPGAGTVEAPKLTLKPSGTAGLALLPLGPGNEWKYDLERKTETSLTRGDVADSTGVIEESGTLIRGLGPSSGNEAGAVQWPLQEEERVFASAPSAEETGEQHRQRTLTYVQGPGGLLLSGPGSASEPALFLPADLAVGRQWKIRLSVGDYILEGDARAEDGGSVTTPAGDFATTLAIHITPKTLWGSRVKQAACSGTVTLWLAADVGEVKQQVDIRGNIATVDPVSGASVVGTLSHSETLELASSALAKAQ